MVVRTISSNVCFVQREIVKVVVIPFEVVVLNDYVVSALQQSKMGI